MSELVCPKAAIVEVLDFPQQLQVVFEVPVLVQVAAVTVVVDCEPVWLSGSIAIVDVLDAPQQLQVVFEGPVLVQVAAVTVVVDCDPVWLSGSTLPVYLYW